MLSPRDLVLLVILHALRTPGVEPGSQAWGACMMPLHYVRCWRDQEVTTEKPPLNFFQHAHNTMASYWLPMREERVRFLRSWQCHSCAPRLAKTVEP